METRIITPAPAAPAELDTLEVAAIDTQRRRFGWVSLAAIVVSFVHMAAALVLFSSATWYERAAALGMTALVDVATWAVAEYLDYARRRGMARSPWIKVLFGFALAISMFLNGAYLWAHRPPAETLPEWMSGGIAIAFALFVPLLIAVASLARGELTDDRLQLMQGAQHERSARAALGDAEGRVAHLEAELRSARAALAQWEREAVEAQATAAQWSRTAEERDAQRAQELAQARAVAAQISDRAAHELAQTRATATQAEERAAQLEQALAQEQRQNARLVEEYAQLKAEAAQRERDGAQLLTQERAQVRELRAVLADLEGQLAQALAAGPLDAVRVARRLIELGETQRKAAEFVGLKESTLRSRLRPAGA